jgi:hypothetical protein
VGYSFGDTSFRKRFAPNKRAFDPYNPTVPTGSYDPGLDSALQAANRGLQDTELDTQTAQQRGLIDYGLQNDQINLGRDRSLADLGQSRDRGTADLGTARTNEGQDYQQNVGLLTRQFTQLGNQQRQDAIHRGVVHGGSLLQAAAKRGANQAIARQPMDTEHSRFLASNDLAGQRLNEDYATQSGRVTADATSALGQNALAYARGTNDSGLALLRAQREGSQFGIDTQTQKIFQASQNNWIAPTRPKNEFTTAAGDPYRVLMQGKKKIRVNQYGARI